MCFKPCSIYSLSILLSVSLSNSSLKKKRTRSIFSSLFCCLRSYDAEPPATPNNNSSPLPPPVEENGAPPKVRRPNILFTQGVITVSQMRIDSETSASASHRHVWFADVKQKSSQLSLSFSVQTVSHLSELLSICLVVQHLISSPVCFLCLHLSCPSVTRLRSSLSPVYVWFHSTPCRLSVRSRMPHGAPHHCTLESTFEAALWTVMHFAWWMLACTVYYTTSEAPGKPNVFPHNYRLRHFQHVLAMPTLLLFNYWEYDCFWFDNASVFHCILVRFKGAEQNFLH